jgi:hypothetical protein
MGVLLARSVMLVKRRQCAYIRPMLTPQLEIANRLRSGMTQVELAAELGIDPTSLAHVLANRRPLPEHCLPKLGLERIVTYRRKRSPANGNTTSRATT